MTFKVIGHRGKGPTSNQAFIFPEQCPENTLIAFQKAIEEGADGIEFDVSISKDNEIVVIHNDELNRNVFEADRDKSDLGYTYDYTVEELKHFDVGNGQKIPTLCETLDLIVAMNDSYKEKTGKDLVINVELKGDNVVNRTHETVAAYVESGKLTKEAFIFNSFKWDCLRQMRALDNDVKLVPNVRTMQFFGIANVQMPGFTVKEDADYASDCAETLQSIHDEINCHAYDCVIYDVRPELVDVCKKNGIGLYVSTSCQRANSSDLVPVLTQLADYSEELPVTFFKADDPGSTLCLKNMLEAKHAITAKPVEPIMEYVAFDISKKSGLLENRL